MWLRVYFQRLFVFGVVSSIFLVGCGGGDGNNDASDNGGLSATDSAATLEAQVETRVAATITAVAVASSPTATTVPATPTPTVTHTAEPSATPSSTVAPTLTLTVTASPTDTVSPTPAATETPDTTATFTPVSPSPTVTTLPTLTSTVTPRPTSTATATPTTIPTVTPLPVSEVTIELPAAATTMDMLAALNEWRLEEGLWPLKLNDTLSAMALEQAEYINSLSSIPPGGDIHLGPNGETVWERAASIPYSWPSYTTRTRLSISEIAYVGASINAAINFWQGSSIHRSTVTNDNYREIGIGAVPHPYGHLWIVVMGARPEVLPAFVQPQTGELYLSNETYSRAARSGWLQDADRFQLLPGVTDAVDDQSWQNWAARIPLPGQTFAQFVVAYFDGTTDVVTVVDPVQDILWLPETVAAARQGALTLTVSGGTTVLAAPTTTPTPTPAVEVTAIPTAVVDDADTLVIYYSDRSLTVKNDTNRALDLSTVVLASVDGSAQIPLTSWDNQFATVPVSFFPAQGCVQVWSWDEAVTLSAPRECRVRRSVITVPTASLFWAQGNFIVQQDDETLATCAVGAGQCTGTLR